MDEQCRVELGTAHMSATARELEMADRALLAIGGMGCANCAARVRNSLISIQGVYGVDVFLNLGLAEVYYDARAVSVTALKDAVHRAGNDGRHHFHADLITAA